MNKYPKFKTIKRMLRSVREKDKSIFFLCFFYTIIAGILPLFAVVLPKFLLAALLEDATDFDYILKIIIAFVGLMGVFGFIKSFLSNVGYTKIMYIRVDEFARISHKINNIDYKYMEDSSFWNKTESSIKALNSNNDGFEGSLHQLFVIPASILTITVYLVLAGMLSVWVLFGLLVSVIVSVLVTSATKKYRYKNREKLSKADRKIHYYSTMTHDFTYGKDIRLYNMEKHIEKKYNYEIISFLSVFRKIKNKEYLLGIVDLFFVLLSDALVYGILISKVLDGLSMDYFSMYLLIMIALSTMLKKLCEDVMFVIGEGQYVNDYYNFYEDNSYQGNVGELSRIENGTLEIEFQNVYFKYPNTEKWIFENLNIKINKGEKIAVVGVNGAGKTTFVKLVLGLFEPTSGDIYINGINIKDFKREEYYKMFSVVFQEINVLAYTIKENITLKNSDNEARVWECLEMVGLKDKVNGFEKGINQMMLKVIDENGAIFSGGENQKLAIARALYKDGNVVILDEPTAALDALAEEKIYQDFNQLINDKTAIYISHRLASTKFCDRIVMFGGTNILESGTHEELLEKKGVYYEMFIIQGKYYQEANDEAN